MGPEAMAQTGVQEVPSEHQETLLYCENAQALSQVAQGYGGIWSLCPWRYSKATWAWSWATGPQWPCLGSEVGLNDLHRSFNCSANL